MPNHDLSSWQDRNEDALAEQYERDVAERGVGPFYGWTGTPTANTPPRSE